MILMIAMMRMMKMMMTMMWRVHDHLCCESTTVLNSRFSFPIARHLVESTMMIFNNNNNNLLLHFHRPPHHPHDHPHLLRSSARSFFSDLSLACISPRERQTNGRLIILQWQLWSFKDTDFWTIILVKLKLSFITISTDNQSPPLYTMSKFKVLVENLCPIFPNNTSTSRNWNSFFLQLIIQMFCCLPV